MTTKVAYTVGGYGGYGEGRKAGDSLDEWRKSVGGVVFQTQDDAEALLSESNGLPARWGYGANTPAAVYILELPSDFDWDRDTHMDDGDRVLSREALIGPRVSRVIGAPGCRHT